MSIAPSLVNRLKSLQQLHQEAAVFSETIKMLSAEQSKIGEEVKGLEEVTGNVSTYVVISAILCLFFPPNFVLLTIFTSLYYSLINLLRLIMTLFNVILRPWIPVSLI